MQVNVEIHCESQDVQEYLVWIRTSLKMSSMSSEEQEEFMSLAKEAFINHTNHLLSRAFEEGRSYQARNP